MASISELIGRMREQAWRLDSHARRGNVPGVDVDGWAVLAGSAERAVRLLEPDPSTSEALAALLSNSPAVDRRRGVLEPLAVTLGAVGDVLDSNEGIVQRSPLAERARLRMNLMATLHLVANCTIRQAAVPEPLRGPLSQLVQSTETAVLIPADRRSSVLDHLTIVVPADGTLNGAISHWAHVAARQLASPAQVTGYTFQSSAGVIALLCARTAEASRELTRHDRTDESPDVLHRAFHAWREAANWPSHVRLGGGGTADLRRATGALVAGLAGQMAERLHPVARMLVLQEGLHKAEQVAVTHRNILAELVRQGGLWIAAESLSPRWLAAHPQVRPTGWINDPDPGARIPLVEASIQAGSVLRQAINALDRTVLATTSMSVGRSVANAETGPEWEVVTYRGAPVAEPLPSPQSRSGTFPMGI